MLIEVLEASKAREICFGSYFAGDLTGMTGFDQGFCIMLVYDFVMGVILGTDFSYGLDLTGSLWIAGCLETGAV